MRKLFLAAFFVACLGLSGVYGVDGGIIGGMSAGWIGGDDWNDVLKSTSTDNEMKFSLQYGAFLEFDYDWFVTFRPELHVLDIRGGSAGSGITIDATSRAVHIPLLAIYRYPLAAGSIYGSIGPSVNLILRDVRFRKEEPGNDAVLLETPYYGVAYGLILGAGYEIPVRSVKIIADFRYHRSLTQVIKFPNINFQNFAFLVGVSREIPND